MKIFTYLKNTLVLSLLLMGSGALSANQQTCIDIPEDQSGITVCESEDSYTFVFSSDKTSFAKKAYQQRFYETLKNWFNLQGLDEKNLCNAQVDLWIAVPEINPDAAQARAVITLQNQKFVVFTGLAPSDWHISNDQIGVLDQQSYPNSYGFRSGQLLISAKPATPEPALNNALARWLSSPLEKISETLYLARVSPLSESVIESEINNDLWARRIVSKIEKNLLFEWIAWRGKGFSFTLECDATDD